MKHLPRICMIILFLLASTIIIHTTKAPQKLPLQGFRVACMPANAATASDADKQLLPYAQLAHTSYQEEDASKKLWRCYFRFAPRDLVCMKKEIADRQPTTQQCPNFPTIDGGSKKTCYLLNTKFLALTNLLQKKPTVSTNVYTTRKNVFVKTWPEVRDILLGKE
jgi:hypothetical protein